MKVIVHLDNKVAIEMDNNMRTSDGGECTFDEVCIEICSLRRIYDSSGTCCFPIGDGANKIVRIEVL